MEVCTTVADYGGRGFKKALIQALMASEDASFTDEIVYNHLARDNNLDRTEAEEDRRQRTEEESASCEDRRQRTETEEDFTSCEGSEAEEEEDWGSHL